MRLLLVAALLVSSFAAHADRAARAKPPSVVGRVVGIDIFDDAVVVTVAAGSEMGITKKARARFREGTTTKLLAGGDAMVVRIDRRVSILKTNLSPAQVRANKHVQFDP